MPVLVTDYSWTQTDAAVHVLVPLKGAKAGKVDIVSTDEYLKVHYPPYLFEAFLLEPVDSDRGTAKVGDGVAAISLPKRASRTWERLTIITSDGEKKKARETALLKHQEKLSSESRLKAERQHAQKKYALETMMKLEKEEREDIQKIRDAEREKVTVGLETWQQQQRQKAAAAEEEEEEEEVRGKLHGQTHEQSKAKATTEEREAGGGSTGRRDQRADEANGRKKQADVPAPRPGGSIKITFTPRVFPTALRESRLQEEEEWLKKQAEARRGVNAEDEELKGLQEANRNPDWLKDKGDKFFATGDFLSAVNAYNLAIRLNGKIPALYSNRAACHLKLRNLHKAIEDSSQALDLLTPPVAANAAARVRASVRRGYAFCQLQLYAEGLQDYQAALEIDPLNEALQADTRRIRDIIQGTSDDLSRSSPV